VRIHHPSAFASSVLFTIAFVCLIPSSLANAGTTVDNMVRSVGFASLAIILSGLVVTWAGFLDRVRWAWFVMFIIVWVWVFPCLILPFLLYTTKPVPEILSDAFKQPGLARDAVEEVLIFSLMVVALILPVRSILFSRKPSDADAAQPSRWWR